MKDLGVQFDDDDYDNFINANAEFEQVTRWDATPDECRQLAAMIYKNHMFHEGEKFEFSSCGELNSFQFFFSFFERVGNKVDFLDYGNFTRNSTTEMELRHFSEQDCNAAATAYTVAIVGSALLVAASALFLGAAIKGWWQNLRNWALLDMSVIGAVLLGAVATMIGTAHRSWDVSAAATVYEVSILCGIVGYGGLLAVAWRPKDLPPSLQTAML